jgi:hypothetical protein
VKGDLDAAQQVMATLWVTMSEAKGLLSASDMPREKVAEMLDEALRNVAELYARGMGDAPEAKPTRPD